MQLVMCCCRGRGEDFQDRTHPFVCDSSDIAVSRAGPRLPKEGSVLSNKDDVESGIANVELQAVFLEEEVRRLKNALAIERAKSNRLVRIIEKKMLERQKSSRYV